MPRYHINPSSGRANVCRAEKRKCPIGGEHFESIADAQMAISKQAAEGNTSLSSLRRKPASGKRTAAREAARNYAVLERGGASKAELTAAMRAWIQADEEVYMEMGSSAVARKISREGLVVAGKKLNASGESHIKRKVLEHELVTRFEEEKAAFYKDIPPMNSFQTAITDVLVEDGNLYNGRVGAWGDSRGRSDYEGHEHLRRCRVVAVSDYDEAASWTLNDSFTSESEIGVKAEVSCRCGEVYKEQLYMQGNTGRLMNRLMTNR